MRLGSQDHLFCLQGDSIIRPVVFFLQVRQVMFFFQYKRDLVIGTISCVVSEGWVSGHCSVGEHCSVKFFGGRGGAFNGLVAITKNHQKFSGTCVLMWCVMFLFDDKK